MTMAKCQDFFQCLVCNTFFFSMWKVEKHIKLHQNEEDKRPENGSFGGGGGRRGMLPIKKVSISSCFVPVVKNQIDPVFLEQYSEVQAKEESTSICDFEDSSVNDSLILHEGGKRQRKCRAQNPDSEDDNDSKPPVFVNKQLTNIKRKVGRPFGSKREIKICDIEDSSSVNDSLILPEGEKRLRKCRVQAVLNIQRATAILKIPEQSEDITTEQQEEMDCIQDLLAQNPDSEGDDDDFKPPAFISKKFSNIKRKIGRPFGSKGKPKIFTSRKKSFRALKYVTNKEKKNEGTTNTCQYCSERFPSRDELLSHMHENHQDEAKIILCPISSCEKPCINFPALRSHLKLHSDAERKELALTQKANKNISNLESCEDQEPYIPETDKEHTDLLCKFCLEKCHSLTRLKAHFETSHTDFISILKCPLCNKETPEDGIVGFIGHMKGLHSERIDPFDERRKERDEVRMKEKQFKCDKENCNKAFAFKFQLRNHIHKHDRIEKQKIVDLNDPMRKFKCPVCEKRFKFKDNLRRHFTLHLENNPFVCEFPGCNRKFNSDYNLRRHRSLHFEATSNAQRVHCPLCDASFTRKDKLPGHMRKFHKPGDDVQKKGYQKRLPRCTRVPRFQTYKDLQDAIKAAAKSSSDSTAENTGVVKTEAIHFTTVEEVHLVDKIILGQDGTAMHIKGEQLSPEKVSSSLQPNNNSNNQSGDMDVILEPPLVPMTSLSKLITSDPLFEKLSKEDPDKVKDIVACSYNYMTGRTFDCQLCEAVFTRAWTLQLHLKTIHKQTNFGQKQLNGLLERGGTGELDTDKITLLCGTCAYPALDAKDLDDHINASHKKIQCSNCGIFLSTKRKLQDHIQVIHRGIRNFRCKFCSLTFTSKTYVQHHEKKVHGSKKQCPVAGCHKILAYTSYNKHVKGHEKKAAANDKDTSKHRCMLCGDTLSCAPALRRHIDAVHLGKPINRKQKSQGKQARPGRPHPGTIRRGPKTPGDEWFQPLLDTALGVTPNRRTDQDVIQHDGNTPTSNSNENAADKEGEGFGSILGF